MHVAQCERWGPLFLPAYGVASLVARARGGDRYRDNAFEREAFARERALAAADAGVSATSAAGEARRPPA